MQHRENCTIPYGCCYKRNIDNPVKIIYCRNYEEVVKTAKENSVEGLCFISPASTSFDMFKILKNAVRHLKDLLCNYNGGMNLRDFES